MKVRCIDNSALNNLGVLEYLTIGNEYDVIDESENFYKMQDNVEINCHGKEMFTLVEERPIIDYKGIQTEVFTIEEKKVIAVEKDIIKLEIYNDLLRRFKVADEQKRYAILDILLQLGYPETDMVKLYQKMANES